ncbi:MAG: hypothetical protein JKX92_12555 [Porticoccaceae bacterium]|nr:hypothetical protein [Porticoccaceae bacterium]
MKLVIVSLFVILLSAQVGFSQQTVANKLRFEITSNAYEIFAGKQHAEILGEFHSGDTIEISIAPENEVYPDVSAYVCHEIDARVFMNGRSSNCRGMNKGIAPYSFKYDVSKDGSHYLVFDNGYSLMNVKRGSYNAMLTAALTEKQRLPLEAMFSKIPEGIGEIFRVEPFNAYLKPCGEKNAYSNTATGDIVFCSELFFPLIMKRREGAVMGIMMHEVGHTLLSLWGMPNFDNEQTVDEFAMVFLYMDGSQEKAFEWLAYFEEHNSAQQAAFKLTHDDRHPISIQRARNIKRILRNPKPVIDRWNNFLYPHMTDKALNDIISNAGKYGNVELAKKTLLNRDQ